MATESRVFAHASLIRRIRGEERGGAIPFWGLMVFTFINFVSPQAFVPILRSLRIALVSAGITLVAYLLDRLSRGRPLTVTVPAVRWLFWFIALAAASVPLSVWPGGSADAFFNDLLKSVLIFLLVANSVDSVRRLKLMIGSMAVWSSLMAWTAVRDFREGNFYLGSRIYGYESPLAENPNTLALTLSLVVALLIGMYYAARSSGQKWAALAGIGLSVAGVIVSFSRGGFLGLMVIAVMVLIKRTRERGPAALGWTCLVLLLSVLVLPHGYVQRIGTIFDTSADPNGSADARWTMMVHAWNAMWQHPVLGAGLRMEQLDIFERLGDWEYVHNAYLQVAAELGIPALVVYVLMIRELLRGLRRSMRQAQSVSESRTLAGLGTGIQMALVAFLVGAFFHPVAYQLYLFYVGGLAVAFSEITKGMQRRPPGEAEEQRHPLVSSSRGAAE